jgi:hypothetical protein
MAVTLAVVPDVMPGPIASSWVEIRTGTRSRAASARLSGPDVDLAERALDVADRLPVDGPQIVLDSVRGSENRWQALAGARETLRALALADPSDLRTLVALGILSVATRIEVDRRRGVQNEDDTE